MWRHTSFLTGGPVDILAEPYSISDLGSLLSTAEQYGTRPFILGRGSNILVADEGIEGLTISMRHFNSFELEKNEMALIGAGTDASEAAWRLGTMGYSALDFLFGMPGTIGGAVWMNARCYGREIAEHLYWVEFLDSQGRQQRMNISEGRWAYKTSPFQSMNAAITRVALKLRPANSRRLRREMMAHRNDRHSKGHYRFPCAGSAFKNNRLFGAPSGAIIDSCGLKKTRIGGASVSPWHGNIIINDKGARSADIHTLIIKIQTAVAQQKGYSLEPEIIMIGRWRNDQ